MVLRRKSSSRTIAPVGRPGCRAMREAQNVFACKSIGTIYFVGVIFIMHSIINYVELMYRSLSHGTIRMS